MSTLGWILLGFLSPGVLAAYYVAISVAYGVWMCREGGK